jgi:hypothetical protein
MWSPPVIGPVARRRVLIGRAGWHSPVAARAGIIRPCRKRKPLPCCPNARTSRVRSSLCCRPLSHTTLLLHASPTAPLAILSCCLSSCQGSVVRRARMPSESLLPTALSARSWSERRSRASHRAAVRRPVSGLNRCPECFLQTSTLASFLGRPEPFPGCHRDHVRVHLHKRCCTFATGYLTPLYSYCR